MYDPRMGALLGWLPAVPIGMAVLPPSRTEVLVVAPIWRAGQFLSPAGVALWVGGMSLMLVGVMCVFAVKLA